MLGFIFNKKYVKKLAKEIAQETSRELAASSPMKDELTDIREILIDLHKKVTLLENRFNAKEIQDKQSYGHLQYKISELNSDLIINKTKKN